MKKRTNKMHLGRIMQSICIFSGRPICKLPCRWCKMCWDAIGCMGCINEKRRNSKDCNH